MIRLDDYWYSQNPVAWLLLPLSWLFCATAMLRRLFYQGGLIKTCKMPVPVIIVGNISVGGTGKTPLLIALCDILKQRGISAGIVSRGYAGNFSGEQIITDNDKPSSVGDEPYLLRRRTGLPVVVGTNRPAAIEQLLAHQHCDVVLCDDGLQHYRLRRDLEIAVVDAGRGFGNGFCLPAGPLRETPRRLQEVDIVAWHNSVHIADENRSSFALEFGEAINLVTGEKRAVESFADMSVHAVAGIGHPARFFNQLEHAGLDIIEHAFPDHHAYTFSDLEFSDEKAILMTEKDAVKCSAFNNHRLWYIPVTARLSEQLVGQFTNAVSRLIKTDA